MAETVTSEEPLNKSVRREGLFRGLLMNSPVGRCRSLEGGARSAIKAVSTSSTGGSLAAGATGGLSEPRDR